MLTKLTNEARVRTMLSVLHEVKGVRRTSGRALSTEGKRLVRFALRLWPYGLQEFDRVAVELYNVPPVALAKLRNINHLSLGCYDKRVKNRYRHLTTFGFEDKKAA